MDVNEAEVTEGRGRRRHSPEFKARLVEECRQPGMSVARVARDNGVNANLLHQLAPLNSPTSSYPTCHTMCASDSS
jgi:hypothetical protein